MQSTKCLTGINLPPLDAEECDDEHRINVETIEDEYYATVDHPMTRDHYFLFLAAVYAEAVTGFIVLKTKLTVN